MVCSLVLGPITSQGEIHVIDSLLSYKSSSSNSDGEGVIKADDCSKIPVIRKMPVVVSMDENSDDHKDKSRLIGVDNIERPTSSDSNAQAHGAENIWFRGLSSHRYKLGRKK